MDILDFIEGDLSDSRGRRDKNRVGKIQESTSEQDIYKSSVK